VANFLELLVFFELLKTLATQFAPQDSQAEQSAAEQGNCRAAIRNRGL
jgi:hypothetical protein